MKTKFKPNISKSRAPKGKSSASGGGSGGGGGGSVESQATADSKEKQASAKRGIDSEGGVVNMYTACHCVDLCSNLLLATPFMQNMYMKSVFP